MQLDGQGEIVNQSSQEESRRLDEWGTQYIVSFRFAGKTRGRILVRQFQVFSEYDDRPGLCLIHELRDQSLHVVINDLQSGSSPGFSVGNINFDISNNHAADFNFKDLLDLNANFFFHQQVRLHLGIVRVQWRSGGKFRQIEQIR